MNEKTKLVVTFLAGVVIGVLGATSTLFQGEPDQAPTEIATRDTGRETGREAGPGAAQTAEPRAPLEQAAAGPESSEPQAEAAQAQPEPDVAQAEPASSDVVAAEEGTAEDGDALVAEGQASEDRIFCMQMENSGQCRCYDAETMFPAEVSPEECKRRLTEE